MVFVLVLLLVAVAQQAPPRDTKPVPARGGGVIAGRVVDADTGTPIPGAQVTITRMRASERPTQLEADEHGGFRLDGLAPGDYRVGASAPEHRPTHVGRTLNFDPLLHLPMRPSLQLKAGEVREDIVLGLERALAIEGRVVDEQGEPVAEARITLERLQGVGSGSGADASTDDRGHFRAFGLAAGSYRVCASPGYMIDFRLGPPTYGDVAEHPYVRTCSPRLVLRPGGAQHVSLVMNRVLGYSVTGRVASESGRRMLRVSLNRLDEDGNHIEAVVKDGAFIARGVPPGEYAVRANGLNDGRTPMPAEVATATIRVDAGDVSGLDLLTTKGASVKGRIVATDPLPAGAKLMVFRGSTYRRMFSPGTSPITVGQDLTFELTGVHEPLLFALQGLPRGWVMTSVRYRGTEIIDRLTTLATTREPSELEIVVTPRSAQLNVRPVDGEGRLAEAARVLLIGATGDRMAIAPAFDVEPAADGARPMPPVRPGAYVVMAVRPGEALPRVDLAALLRQYGRQIMLEAGEQRTIDIAVTSIPEAR